MTAARSAARPSVGLGFYALLVPVGFVTFLVHEAAHWLAGKALGYPMIMRLNGARATVATTPLDAALISAAGPAITVLQAVIALALVLRRRSLTGFAFLFWAAFMRFMATVISLFNANDEARVSLYLGWNPWIVPIAVTVALGALAWAGGRRLALSWTVGLLAWLTASVTVSLIVGLDSVLAH